MICKLCKGRGWLIWIARTKRPRAAYWFNRGPEGQRPVPCDCGVVE